MPDDGFAERLHRLRKAAGLSRAQPGEKIGLTDKAVSKWESGRTKPGRVHRTGMPGSKPGLNRRLKLRPALAVKLSPFLLRSSRKEG